jgi:hypothetical protein
VLTTKKKDEKIIVLKTDLAETKSKFEVIEVAHNALVITHSNAVTDLEQSKKDYRETAEKLHLMNKARHSLEQKLVDEIERNRSLQEIIRLKDETIFSRSMDLERLDKKALELER